MNSLPEGNLNTLVPTSLTQGSSTVSDTPGDKVSSLTNSIIFQDAVADDLASIVEMLADDQLGRLREKTGLPLDDQYLAAFAAIEADPNQRLVVGRKDDSVVATMQLSFLPSMSHRGSWRGQIEAVRVASPWRASGVGKQMIHWAIAQCRSRDCKLIQLTTDKSRRDAHRFYQRFGFVASHEGLKLTL